MYIYTYILCLEWWRYWLWWLTPPCVFSAAGVRTEQDLYARLIDSVTKQVAQFCLQPNFTTSTTNNQSHLVSLPLADIIWGTKQESGDVPSPAYTWSHVQVSLFPTSLKTPLLKKTKNKKTTNQKSFHSLIVFTFVSFWGWSLRI